MKIRAAFNLAAATLQHPKIVFGRKQFVFLLSHMRSYSSLLAHILGSHPEVSGHVERLRSYRGSTDLARVRIKDYQQGGDPNCRYLLDKVLHKQYFIAPDILQRTNVKPVIFIRQPEATFKSISNLGSRFLHDEKYCEMPAILDYYKSRLDQLVEIGSMAATRPIYFDAEAIVNDSNTLLDSLSEWLELSEPLKSEYTVFSDTGEAFKGDPSGQLGLGKIAATPSTEKEDVEVPSEMLAEAKEHYQKTRALLIENCLPVCT